MQVSEPVLVSATNKFSNKKAIRLLELANNDDILESIIPIAVLIENNGIKADKTRLYGTPSHFTHVDLINGICSWANACDSIARYSACKDTIIYNENEYNIDYGKMVKFSTLLENTFKEFDFPEFNYMEFQDKVHEIVCYICSKNC